MSLIIKDIDMPECCFTCPCCFPDDYSNIDLQCGALNILNGKENGVNEENGILKNCPLAEIPTPHGRLIDAYLLLAIMRKRLYGNPEFDYIIELVERQRTIIEAEE